MDISKNAQNLFDSVILIVNKLLSKVKFNYTAIGAIVAKNDDGTYKVRINNSTTDIESLHGIEYKENEVVYILIMNQDFNKKLILDSVYNSRNLEEKIKKDIMKEVEKMIDEKLKILVEQLNTVNEVKET